MGSPEEAEVDGLVQIAEAARQVGVDRSTLYRWERRGMVTPLRDYRGWRFYCAEDIERLRKWREPKLVVRDGARRDRLSR